MVKRQGLVASKVPGNQEPPPIDLVTTGLPDWQSSVTHWGTGFCRTLASVRAKIGKISIHGNPFNLP